MIFEEIIGNEKNKKILNDILKSNKTANSYMFVGQESIGKMLFAKEFAKAILCENEEKPCNNCKSCIEFNTNNNPDFNIIESDGKTIKIDQIRELTKKVYEKPIISNKKVYIINDSNLMTKEAQNSLLKTLEEPPEYVTIILVTSNESMFLPTIKSRCTKILFNKLTNEELEKILDIKYNYKDITEFVLKVASGSVEKAILTKDKEEQYKSIYDIFIKLEGSNFIDFICKKEEIFSNKDDVEGILNYINIIFFEKLNQNIKYANCINILENIKDRLKKNCNYDMTIDDFLMTVWEEING